jgi:hypothetical protein
MLRRAVVERRSEAAKVVRSSMATASLAMNPVPRCFVLPTHVVKRVGEYRDIMQRCSHIQEDIPVKWTVKGWWSFQAASEPLGQRKQPRICWQQLRPKTSR